MPLKVLNLLKNPQIFAHRGASGEFFENSFEAFDQALLQHAEGLETDCWRTRDGKIVLHHGKFISSPAISHPINIHNSNYTEMKDLSLPNGEKIPTLRQFFDKYANRSSQMQFSLDLQDHIVGQAILPLLKEYDLLDRVILCADNMTKIKRLRKLSSEVQNFPLLPKRFGSTLRQLKVEIYRKNQRQAYTYYNSGLKNGKWGRS